ncbi:hypothetical protein [Streptomyces sp. NPDC001279]|uniref:hypothetical protein n=1 Tax=unclassified Streptomyces TaxID=2593676 RepID=UPI00369404DD
MRGSPRPPVRSPRTNSISSGDPDEAVSATVPADVAPDLLDHVAQVEVVEDERQATGPATPPSPTTCSVVVFVVAFGALVVRNPASTSPRWQSSVRQIASSVATAMTDTAYGCGLRAGIERRAA